MALLGLMVIGSFIAGGVFASLAAWLTTKKGNTLADIANASKLSDAQAIKVEILKKISLASNYPIVGLYLISAIIPLGTVVYLLFSIFPSNPGLVMLSGSLSPQPALGSPVCVTTAESQVDPSGAFTVALPYGDTPEHVIFGGKDYFPETMLVTFDKASMAVHVQLTSNADSKPYDIKLNPPSREVSLPSPIPMALMPK